MPCKCGQKVDRIGAKIQCSLCKVYYHMNCVNLQQSDSEYMKKNNIPYRCVSCDKQRRHSLRSPPPASQKVKQVHNNNSGQTLDGEVLLSPSNLLSSQPADVNIISPNPITLDILYK